MHAGSKTKNQQRRNAPENHNPSFPNTHPPFIQLMAAVVSPATTFLRPTLILIITIVVLFPISSSSLSEAEALLNLKNSLTTGNANNKALTNWVANSLPCDEDEQWDGVVCNDGAVTGIHLAGMGLSGKIDIDALLEIKGLRTISFERNSFSGSLPEFNRIGYLRAISLSENQFSGEIPLNYFQNMGSLKKLWLSYNNFSGQIPSSLAQVPTLTELYLENNQFSGKIPDVDKPTLVKFNVSNNKLEGEIPTSLLKFGESSFSGNSGLCGEKLGKVCEKVEVEQPKQIDTQNSTSSNNSNNVNNGNNGSDSHSTDQLSSVKIAVIVASSLAIFSLLVLVVVRTRRKKENIDTLGKEHKELAVEVKVAPAPVKKASSKRGFTLGKGGVGLGDLVMLNKEKVCFGLPDLMKASAEVLGNGGVGSSYKAVLANGVAVVVKRMREMNAKGKDGFDAQMRNLGKLKHWNILTPLAYHYRKDEKLVVFEYVPKGSLLYLLRGDRGPSHAELDWPARLKIVKGIAKGMRYLHTELAPSNLPHGNLKSSNILLGPNYEPLLVDYGYNSLVSAGNVTQALFAYKAPEAAQGGLVSPKCDVYCLGIVILELLTGKFPSQYLNNGKGGFDVVQWIGSAISERRESELLDPKIASSKNSLGDMVRLLNIGATCTESNPELRLDMMEAIRRIEEVKAEGVGPESRTVEVLPSLIDEDYSNI